MFLLFLNLRCAEKEGLFTHPSAAPFGRRFLVPTDETVTKRSRFLFLQRSRLMRAARVWTMDHLQFPAWQLLCWKAVGEFDLQKLLVAH
jgi:hypothetical protein